jgi:hypothetical protein
MDYQKGLIHHRRSVRSLFTLPVLSILVGNGQYLTILFLLVNLRQFKVILVKTIRDVLSLVSTFCLSNFLVTFDIYERLIWIA